MRPRFALDSGFADSGFASGGRGQRARGRAASRRPPSDGPRTPARAPAGAPLAALAGGALAGRFHGWRGRSGRRRLFTVFPGFEPCPDFPDAVLAVVVLGEDGTRRLIDVAETGPVPGLAAARAERIAAASGTPRERIAWHVHLIAEDAAARAAVVADLSP